MSELIERVQYNEQEDRLIVQTTYDNSAVIEANKAAKNAAPEFGRYKGNLVKVGSIHEGDVVRLKNMGYNLFSSDPAEVRRALMYLQENEQHMLTVPGKPFAKVRPKWA
jgi:hypothetical protein